MLKEITKMLVPDIFRRRCYFIKSMKSRAGSFIQAGQVIKLQPQVVVKTLHGLGRVVRYVKTGSVPLPRIIMPPKLMDLPQY